jgi:acetyl esterase
MLSAMPHSTSLHARLRRRAGAMLVDHIWIGLAAAGRWLPASRPARHNVEVVRDIPYVDNGAREHVLDVYRPIPKRGENSGPLPVVLYIHGGGFRLLSKDTHYVMALAFARRGYLVCNISYRLAPRHPFPAGVIDAAAAYRWVLEHVHEFGGDPSRIVLAGESAGANLATVLAIASCWRRPEPWAQQIYDLGRVPAAVIAACGLLQVRGTDRFRHGPRPMPLFFHDHIVHIAQSYLGIDAKDDDPDHALADPLVVLEGAGPPDRPLPPFFAPVGTRDPVADDTRRLAAALQRLGVPCDAPEYEGETHAFHAIVFLRNARRCWSHTYRFLDGVLRRADAHADASGAA